MKRLMSWLLATMLFVAAATAESLVDDDYTDVPTAMTQDSVAELLADQECLMETLQPDEESVALLDSVYRFVWEEKIVLPDIMTKKRSRKLPNWLVATLIFCT